MDEKDREQTEDQGRNAFSRVLLGSLVALVLYVLSTGPVLKFHDPSAQTLGSALFIAPSLSFRSGCRQ